LTIDNNLRERTVPDLALAQANWKFTGSEPAGYRMPVLFTIMANANDIILSRLPICVICC
jgi:hypothetical protein